MRYSSKQVVHPGVRARDLPALMELYELNYIQLRQLLPDLDALQDHSISVVKGALTLYLQITERSKYTTTLHLTYLFDQDDETVAAPDILIRLYHDAQVAEVISRGAGRGQRNTAYDRFRHRYTVEAKWHVNRFLHKWLGYCLNHGHVFSPAREQLSEALQVLENEAAVSLES